MNVEIIKPHRDGKVWVRRGAILRDVAKLRGEELVRLGIARLAVDVQTSALDHAEGQSAGADQASAQKVAAGNPKKPARPRGRAQPASADPPADASATAGADVGQSAGVAPEPEAQGQASADPQAGADSPAPPTGAGNEPDQP